MATGKKTILVVEDMISLLRAIEIKLSLSGYSVIEALDGEEGLAALEKKPDLVWLDLYLPKMHGLEFLKKMNEDSRYAGIPVVVVSASSGAAGMVEAHSYPNVRAVFVKSDTVLASIVEKVKEILVA